MTTYTGPLLVTVSHGRVYRVNDTGDHVVVLHGLGRLYGRLDELVQIRLELTPEDADELITALQTMSQVAKRLLE